MGSERMHTPIYFVSKFTKDDSSKVSQHHVIWGINSTEQNAIFLLEKGSGSKELCSK
jgi:hypothetical protein